MLPNAVILVCDAVVNVPVNLVAEILPAEIFPLTAIDVAVPVKALAGTLINWLPSPIKYAAITLPVVLILPLALSDVKLPTDVRLDATTVEFSVVPVSVLAAAVTVALPPSDTLVPLIVRLLLARYALVMDIPCQVPLVITPTPVILG